MTRLDFCAALAPWVYLARTVNTRPAAGAS